MRLALILLSFGVVGCSSSISMTKIYPGRYQVSGGSESELYEAKRRACPGGHTQIGDDQTGSSVGRAETITEHRAVDGTSTQSSTSHDVRGYSVSAEIECDPSEALQQELVAYVSTPDARCEAATRLFEMCASCRDDLAYDPVRRRCGLAAATAAAPPPVVRTNAVSRDVVGTWRSGLATYTLAQGGRAIVEISDCESCPVHRRVGRWTFAGGRLSIHAEGHHGLSLVSTSELREDGTGRVFRRAEAAQPETVAPPAPSVQTPRSAAKRGELVGVWRQSKTVTWTFSADLTFEYRQQFENSPGKDYVERGTWDVDGAGNVTLTYAHNGQNVPLPIYGLSANAWTDQYGRGHTRER